jgi:protein-serine/threonine kinase
MSSRHKKASKADRSDDSSSESSSSSDKGEEQDEKLREIKQTFKKKGPSDFERVALLGRGDVGRVYLVKMKESDTLFAMKVLKKADMIQRNKVIISLRWIYR